MQASPHDITMSGSIAGRLWPKCPKFKARIGGVWRNLVVHDKKALQVVHLVATEKVKSFTQAGKDISGSPNKIISQFLTILGSLLLLCLFWQPISAVVTGWAVLNKWFMVHDGVHTGISTIGELGSNSCHMTSDEISNLFQGKPSSRCRVDRKAFMRMKSLC